MNDLATIDAPPELRESVSACVKWSNDNSIATQADYQTTGEHLKQLKTQQKKADEFFDPVIKAAHETHKMLVSRKRLITDPLTQAEAVDKRKMLTFQQEEQRKADIERQRLQAIADEKARREREIAEQAAAKQRQIEAEARATAEAARLSAEKATEAERKSLLAMADAADRKANAAAVKVEAKETQAAAAVAPVIQVQATDTKMKGVNTLTVWKFRITDASLVPRDYLMVDEVKLTKFAKAMKDGVKIPGVEFYPEQAISSRGAY